MDFTLTTYKNLISTLIESGYKFQTLHSYFKKSGGRFVVLRHDVDKKNLNSLRFAEYQSTLDIKGSYFFRMVPESFDEKIITTIAGMGHEIGYHYETMDKANGDIKKAYDLFCKELEELRKLVPIKTVCMHGSPLSKYDNREIWEHYDYRELDIVGEPYFDINFNEVLYLTDTGRSWNKSSVSVRDKVQSNFNYNFTSTQDIINGIETLPDKIMINTHPQRWNDKLFPWTKELVMQSVKNVIKKYILVKD